VDGEAAEEGEADPTLTPHPTEVTQVDGEAAKGGEVSSTDPTLIPHPTEVTQVEGASYTSPDPTLLPHPTDWYDSCTLPDPILLPHPTDWYDSYTLPDPTLLPHPTDWYDSYTLPDPTLLPHPTDWYDSCTLPDPTLLPHPTDWYDWYDSYTLADPTSMTEGGEATSSTSALTPHPTEDGNAPIANSLSHVIQGIIDSERELNSIEEEAREGDNTTNKSDIPDDLYFRIQRAGDKLVSNASSLIKNSTSNLAECFMAIRCKFDGGKVFNRVQRGSFHHRCNGAGLRFQLGPDWMSQVWHSVTGQEPGEAMRAYCAKQTLQHQNAMKRKGKNEYKEARKKAR
jgi:hypothetical protein